MSLLRNGTASGHHVPVTMRATVLLLVLVAAAVVAWAASDRTCGTTEPGSTYGMDQAMHAHAPDCAP